MAASDPHDQVAELIRSRRGKQQAITAGEIKDELEIDDGEAQPKTREIIREGIDEYQIPIGAGPQG